MQILFLGTGPTEAIPRKGHTDALCRDARAGGKSRRMRSCALVTSGQTTILIDAGPDIAKQLKQYKPKHIDAVLLTHGHEDAIGGLKDLDEWLGRLGRLGRCRTLEDLVPVYTDHLTAERLTTRFGKFKHLFFSKLKDYSAFVIPAPSSVIPAPCPTFGGKAGIQKNKQKQISDGSLPSALNLRRDDRIRVVPFPVLHTHDMHFQTYGYKFDSFCYASDFYELPKRTKSLLKGLETLILDGAMYLGVKMPTHLSADATVRLASELEAHQLILTQSGHTYPPHDQAELAIRRYALTQQFDFPKQIRLAFDGLKINL